MSRVDESIAGVLCLCFVTGRVSSVELFSCVPPFANAGKRGGCIDVWNDTDALELTAVGVAHG